MTVHWTDTAIGHLLAIYEYIEQDSASYAQRMVDRITRRSELLAQFPLLGSTVPEYQDPDIRQVLEKPYRIIYRVTEDRIDVLAVVHGARQLPPVQ